VRSIPTVVLIRDGQILDGFAGALPESQVREFLSRHNIQPAKKIETPAAQNVTEEGPHTPRETPHAAVARLRDAVEAEPDRPELKLELALAQARAGDINAAKNALESLPAQLETDDRAKALQAYVNLAQALTGTAASGELMARIENDPKDFAARDALGVRLLLGGDPADAMEQFLAILQGDRNWNEGLARKRLLDSFRIVEDEALVASTRRKMSSLLF
jgi:putative thioredoxin